MVDEDANSGFACFQEHDFVDSMISTQPVENNPVTLHTSIPKTRNPFLTLHIVVLKPRINFPTYESI